MFCENCDGNGNTDGARPTVECRCAVARPGYTPYAHYDVMGFCLASASMAKTNGDANQ